MTELKRIGKFGLVGLINTGLDFSLLNILHFHAHMSLIGANVISTTAAMIFSFFANRQVVFGASDHPWWQQAARFWAVTALGLYGLQNGIIWLLSHPLHQLTNVAASLGQALTFHTFSKAFIVANGMKLVATAASLIWNYILYKRLVFTQHPEQLAKVELGE